MIQPAVLLLLQAGGTLEWQLPDGFRMQYQELAGELMVGGVYVRLYLKDPRYPLRWEGTHPTHTHLESL